MIQVNRLQLGFLQNLEPQDDDDDTHNKWNLSEAALPCGLEWWSRGPQRPNCNWQNKTRMGGYYHAKKYWFQIATQTSAHKSLDTSQTTTHVARGVRRDNKHAEQMQQTQHGQGHGHHFPTTTSQAPMRMEKLFKSSLQNWLKSDKPRSHCPTRTQAPATVP